jgi:hypothetical protein
VGRDDRNEEAIMANEPMSETKFQRMRRVIKPFSALDVLV